MGVSVADDNGNQLRVCRTLRKRNKKSQDNVDAEKVVEKVEVL